MTDRFFRRIAITVKQPKRQGLTPVSFFKWINFKMLQNKRFKVDPLYYIILLIFEHT